MHNSGTVGVIMLDTQFPRYAGDIGSQETWPFDVIFEVVTGAKAVDVVESTAKQQLEPFIDAALKLQRLGVCGITTSCGFLTLAQDNIAKHLDIPFIASSLIQVPWVQATLTPNRQVGILTIKSDALTSAHLRSAGILFDPPIKGTENGQEFTRAILGNETTMDKTLCEADNVTAARQFVAEQPRLGALVLECTNMAPYAHAIHLATGLPVYSIYTLIQWFQSGLLPRPF